VVGALAGGATPEDWSLPALPEEVPVDEPADWLGVVVELAGVEEWPGNAWLT
jgi:hypothetical protein